MYTHICVYAYACIQIYTYIYIYIYVCMCVCMYVYIYIYIYIYTHIHTYTYKCVCVCICICVCTYIYIYITQTSVEGLHDDQVLLRPALGRSPHGDGDRRARPHEGAGVGKNTTTKRTHRTIWKQQHTQIIAPNKLYNKDIAHKLHKQRNTTQRNATQHNTTQHIM